MNINKKTKLGKFLLEILDCENLELLDVGCWRVVIKSKGIWFNIDKGGLSWSMHHSNGSKSADFETIGGMLESLRAEINRQRLAV